jgi:hypothetical protein
MQQYAFDKFKFKVYNQLDITGEANFKLNIGEVITQDHTVNILANSSNNALKLVGNINDGTGAKLTLGDVNGVYLQEPEYEDNKLLIYSNSGLILNGTNLYKVGIKTSTPKTLLDVGGGTKRGIVSANTSLLVAGDVEVNEDLYVDGILTVGANGTGIGSIIKYIEYRDITSIGANSAKAETFTVTNAAVGAAVNVSPSGGLPDGINISYARVSAANTVEIKFYNSTGGAIDPTGTTFYFAIIY